MTSSFPAESFCILVQRTVRSGAILIVSALASACSAAEPPRELPVLTSGAQAISLLGDTLYPPPLPEDVREDRDTRLTEARAAYERDPEDADAIIWLGRRTAYLGSYRRAIAIYSEGIRKHPDDARMYRHRGHRFISVRLFDRAIADLERAAQLTAGTEDEIEPDGLPNARNVSTSTLQSNIWYHLGLAYYLKDDLPNALTAYRECLKVSRNPDMLVATSHWLYMTLRRSGLAADAEAVLEPIKRGMDVIENHSYYRLLLMYSGELSPDSLLAEAEAGSAIENATLGYGIGNWYAYNGRLKPAEQVFRNILQGSQWAAFGYIAAEADLNRRSD